MYSNIKVAIESMNHWNKRHTLIIMYLYLESLYDFIFCIHDYLLSSLCRYYVIEVFAARLESRETVWKGY